MRIVHISTSDGGGAGRAALRLHQGLLRLGHDSTMLVRDRATTNSGARETVCGRSVIARIRRVIAARRTAWPLARYGFDRSTHELFSDDRTVHGRDVPRAIPPCDVLNLHWISGFVDYRSFCSSPVARRPLVWTLHDMNPFTGGCHYDYGCGRFQDACGRCPQLRSDDARDLSASIHRRKRRALSELFPDRVVFVADSEWLAARARQSSLLRPFPVMSIHYGLDTSLFAPGDQAAARSALGIGPRARVILCVADDVAIRRKGFAELLEAVARVRDLSDLVLIVVGSGEVGEFSVPSLVLGRVDSDARLVDAYRAADVFLMASLEEAFGQTALEAASCGTPAVAFEVGGIPEIVRHFDTGLTVPRGDIAAMAGAVRRLLTQDPLRHKLAMRCRAVAVQEFALEVQARRYESLYADLLDGDGRVAGR